MKYSFLKDKLTDYQLWYNNYNQDILPNSNKIFIEVSSCIT